MNINNHNTGSFWRFIDIECQVLASKQFLIAKQMRNRFISNIRNTTFSFDELALYLNLLTNEFTNLGELMLAFSFLNSFCGGKK